MKWNEFKKFQIEKSGLVKEWKRGDTDVESNYIRILFLDDQIKYTSHKEATLEDTLKTVLHEFIHICHHNVQKYDKRLRWFFEGIATNLANNNYEEVTLEQCDFDKLINDFNNYGKDNYKYSYTIVSYILKLYSNDEIHKFIYSSNYLLDNSNKIFEEVKNNQKIDK